MLTQPVQQHPLEGWQAQIVAMFRDLSPRKILLFGSACSRTLDEAGDVDLIVVYDTSKRFLDRLKELYERWDLPKAVDILAYTPDEFDRLLGENSFIQDAVKSGLVIYESAG